jgi:hypothetical protein
MTNQDIATALTAAVLPRLTADASAHDIPMVAVSLYQAILRGLDAGQLPYQAMFGHYEQQAKR